jgi:hypothetical protein
MDSVNRSCGNDNTASQPIENSPPIKKIEQNETRSGVVRSGMLADKRGKASAYPADAQPAAKGQNDFLYVYASPSGPTSASPAPSKGTAVDREVNEIISEAKRKIDTSVSEFGSSDDTVITVVALNEACKKASSNLAKQKLLEHPETRQLFDQMATVAARSVPAFLALDSMLAGKDLDPALQDALLKHMVNGDKLVNLLRDSMPPEERTALDHLLANEKAKKLPLKVQLRSLFLISRYPDKKQVIYNLERLIKQKWFLEPHDRKFAVSDQRQLMDIIAIASGYSALAPVLDDILDSPGRIVQLETSQTLTDSGGEYDGTSGDSLIRLNRNMMTSVLALKLAHENYHTYRPEIHLAGGSVPALKNEIGGWIAQYLGGHDKLPSPKEVYMYIRDVLLKDEAYAVFWESTENGEYPAHFAEIIKVMGELVGLQNATRYDMRVFDSKFKDSVLTHLSTEPMSPEDIKNWLGEEWLVGLHYHEPSSKPLSQATVNDWLRRF